MLTAELPANIDAERELVGTMIARPQFIPLVAGLIAAEHFFSAPARLIFQAAVEIHGAGKPVTSISLYEALDAAGNLAKVGGSAEIATLEDLGRAGEQHVELDAEIIRAKAMARDMIAACRDGGAAAASAEPFTVSAVLDETIQALRKIAEGGQGRKTIHSMAEVTAELIETWEAMASGRLPSEKAPILSNYGRLDRLIGGFDRGSITVISGRTSMGKSTFALNLLRNICIDARTPAPALIFSMEARTEQIVGQLICQKAGLSGDVMRGLMSRSVQSKLNTAASHIAESPFYISDRPHPSVSEIRSQIWQAKQNFGIRLAVVDYVQLIRAEGSRGKNGTREQEVAEIMAGLKGIAGECDVAMIAVAQMNRAAEGRENHRPRLSDIRESGSIENDADAVLFVYRPDYYEEIKNNQAEIIVAKQRHGPTGIVKFDFNPSVGEFRELSDAEERNEWQDKF